MNNNINDTNKSIEAGWQTFLDSLINPIFLIDDNGNILKVNRNAADFFEISPQTVIGTNFCKFLFGTDTPPPGCPVDKSLKTKKQEIREYQLENIGKWVRINSYPVLKPDSQIDRLLCIIEDLTETRRIEQDKRIIEDKFQLVFNNIYDVIILFDAKGKVQEVSPSFLKMTGFESSEIIGYSYKDIDILTPESKEALIKNMKQVLKGNRIRMAEYDFVEKDGEIRNCEVNSSPIIQNDKIVGAICTSRNITKRKRAEEAFKESEEKYRALADNPLVGILIIQDNKFVYANNRTMEMHGYSEDEIVDTTTLDMLHPDYRDKAVEIAIQIGRREKPPETLEQKRVKKDGSFFWAATAITPITYMGKSAIAEIIVDITADKKAQEEIKQAHDNLAAALNKLERRNQQNKIIIEMRDMIELTATMQELPPVIISNMERLFPGSAGALFYRDPAKPDMEKIASWNKFPDDVDKSNISCKDCPAYQRGHPYIVEDTARDAICPSMKNTTAKVYACIPIMEKGDIIGLLHIRDSKSISDEERQQLITELKETSAPLYAYLSLSISNLRLTESLKTQAIKDPLTGLFNRRFLMESFTREITRASRKKTNISIVMIDIDHFKKFNDKWGHAAGDELLTRLGKFFMGSIRGSDIVCRYGGEEFIILMPEMDSSAAFNRIDKMREDVKKLKVYYDNQLLPHIALSMGISEFPTHGKDVDDLLRVADLALYKAKQEGRDRVIIA